jgi:hypothetical protein
MQGKERPAKAKAPQSVANQARHTSSRAVGDQKEDASTERGRERSSAKIREMELFVSTTGSARATAPLRRATALSLSLSLSCELRIYMMCDVLSTSLRFAEHIMKLQLIICNNCPTRQIP